MACISLFCLLNAYILLLDSFAQIKIIFKSTLGKEANKAKAATSESTEWEPFNPTHHDLHCWLSTPAGVIWKRLDPTWYDKKQCPKQKDDELITAMLSVSCNSCPSSNTNTASPPTCSLCATYFRPKLKQHTPTHNDISFVFPYVSTRIKKKKGCRSHL